LPPVGLMDERQAEATDIPRIVPVDVAKRSDSIPKRWRTLTNKFGNG